MAIPQKQLADGCCCDWSCDLVACACLRAWWWKQVHRSKFFLLGWKLKTLLPLKCRHYCDRRHQSSVISLEVQYKILNESICSHQSSIVRIQSSFLNGSTAEGRRGERRKLRWIWWRIAHYRVVCINYTVPFYDSSGVRDNYLYFDTFRFWWYSTCTVICFLTPWPSVRMHTTFTFTQSPMKCAYQYARYVFRGTWKSVFATTNYLVQ